MNRRLLLLLSWLLFIAPAFGQTVSDCRAQFARWSPVFKAVYAECQGNGTEACMFVTQLRSLDTTKALELARRFDACAKLDAHGFEGRKRQYQYERIAIRAMDVVRVRMAYYLNIADLNESYAEWEAVRLQAAH